MIKGKRKLDLTPDTILNMVSSYDIFRYYIGSSGWKIGQAMTSPLRKDENPSFVICNKGGFLHFLDFGTGVKGDCFTFVKEKYSLSSLDEALKLIDKDFGLGILSNHNVGTYKEMVKEYKQPESLGKQYSIIQCKVRKFTKEDWQFWNSFHITEEDLANLKGVKIYSIEEAFLNKKKYSFGIGEMRFGYLHDGGYWKIYRPNADKKKKWISNVPLTTAIGLENLCLGHNTLVTKSLKDYIVCRKVYPYTCHVQNESVFAFSDETVEYIKSHSKGVYYNGDADVAGKAASYIITQAFGWKHINSPDRLLPEVNDMAGWAKKEGLDKLDEHFKLKGLK